jgi:hypothetical protein
MKRIKRINFLTVLAVVLGLAACAESNPCYQLTGTALAQCETAMTTRIAELPRGGGNGGGQTRDQSQNASDAQQEAGQNGSSNVDSSDPGGSFGGIGT